jgi:hypothetical protein
MASPSWDLQKAVYAALSGDAALTALLGEGGIVKRRGIVTPFLG